MGQRLNVEIMDGDKVLANAYYHWSAYSGASIEMAKQIIEAYKTAKSIRMIDLAVELLQGTGAGVNEKERERIENDKTGMFSKIKFQNAVDRNRGLLSVTDEGIQETRMWEEGRVSIDLASETFWFGVYWSYKNEDEYRSEYDDPDIEFKTIDISMENAIAFSEIGRLMSVYNENMNGFKTTDGTVITWIE